MKHKNWLIFILVIMFWSAFVFELADRSFCDDGFYVIPVGNRNIKMVDENTAVGIGALQSNTTVYKNTAT